MDPIVTHYEHDGNIVRYIHHDVVVSVKQHLLGRHREHCLCHLGCKFFKPNTSENCPLAQANYRFCVDNNMTLPVWECPKYEHE